MELPNAVEISPTVALQKRQGTESDNIRAIVLYSDLPLEGYSSRTKQRRNAKLAIHNAKGL